MDSVNVVEPNGRKNCEAILLCKFRRNKSQKNHLQGLGSNKYIIRIFEKAMGVS
jgi:hypothetical protein